MPEIPSKSHRGEQNRKCVRKVACPEQSKIVNRGIDAREVVYGVHAERLVDLLDCCLDLASPQKAPSECSSAQSKIWVDLECCSEVNERLFMTSRRAWAGPEHHPTPRFHWVERKGGLGMALSLSVTLSIVLSPVSLRCSPGRPRQDSVCLCIARLDFDGALHKCPHLILTLCNHPEQGRYPLSAMISSTDTSTG